MFESEGYRIPRHIIRKEDVESEIFRLEKAIEDSKKEIDDLEKKVSEDLGSEIGSNLWHPQNDFTGCASEK